MYRYCHLCLFSDIDDCLGNNCTGACIDHIGSFECTCGFGYQLDRDEESCIGLKYYSLIKETVF